MKLFIKLLMTTYVFLYRLTGGAIGGKMVGMPVLLLNSIGRKSGKKRTTPVAYIRDGTNYVVTASNGGAATNPGWFYNLQSSPQTTIQVMAETLSVVAQQANPEEKSRLWSQLIKVAPNFEEYQRKSSREIPMVILHPQSH